MIYPKVSLKKWIEKYQALRVVSSECNRCGAHISSTIPFISKEYIGLISPECSCGKSLMRVESAIPKTKAEEKSWNSVLGEQGEKE